MSKILIFGDSIVWGAVDKEEGGWVDRFKVFMKKKEEIIEVYNLGVSGEKTSGLLKRFEPEVKARIKKDEEITIIFGTGINDFMTPIEEFKENIEELVNLALKFSSKVIFIGLTPVDEFKTVPAFWKPGNDYKNESIEKYNNIISSVCKNKNISFIEIFANWIKSDYKKLLKDSLHPNSVGHKKIFETVKDFLIQNKII